jgi:hypothetical protein
MSLFNLDSAPVTRPPIARQNADQSSDKRESRVPFLIYSLMCAQQNVPPCETPSTSTVPEAFDCHIPVMRFLSKYTLPVSQTRGHAEQHAHEGLDRHGRLVQISAMAGLGRSCGSRSCGSRPCGCWLVVLVLWALVCGSGLEGIDMWEWARRSGSWKSARS